MSYNQRGEPQVSSSDHHLPSLPPPSPLPSLPPPSPPPSPPLEPGALPLELQGDGDPKRPTRGHGLSIVRRLINFAIGKDPSSVPHSPTASHPPPQPPSDGPATAGSVPSCPTPHRTEPEPQPQDNSRRGQDHHRVNQSSPQPKSLSQSARDLYQYLLSKPLPPDPPPARHHTTPSDSTQTRSTSRFGRSLQRTFSRSNHNRASHNPASASASARTGTLASFRGRFRYRKHRSNTYTPATRSGNPITTYIESESPTRPPPTPSVPPHLKYPTKIPTPARSSRSDNRKYTMADQEEDFSSLPLPDRFTHKVWKVRKAAYEEAAKEFEKTADEHAPAFRPFLNDPSLMKGAVIDSNVAAQQDGILALIGFLKFGGRDQCMRTRSHVVSGLVEKGLSSTRAATKANSLEALLLYIELDVAAPVIEDILPFLSHKQPKVIAASLSALSKIYHNYGCKTADPKPVLKLLPKAFGHADKNVRAEATNLAVEFYRWLREAMKPMFWNDLKPTQQTDLEKQFEAIKVEAPPKQERLLRSQQAAKERAPAGGAEDDADEGGDDGEEAVEIDAFDLAEPQDVVSKLPSNFYDNMGSSKWKDRKEALEGLYALVNVPRIKDGDFNEVNRILAKSMKDANIAVVTQAAQCIEMLAKGLRKGYAKYRPVVLAAIMERLKEKKVTVSEALGAALDQVFAATSLTDCLEDIATFLGHKNPQVKEGTMKFLIRCLRTTRDFPAKAEITIIVEGGKKLLSEGSEALRSGGAEVLGTVMKLIGERAMNPLIDGLDDIRKTKIKEFYEKAEVKAKAKPPKPAAAPAARPTATRKVMRKVPAGTKKAKPPAPAPPPAPASPEPVVPALVTPGRPGPVSRLGKPGLKAPGMRKLVAPGAASPRRPAQAPSPPLVEEEPAPPPQPRMGLGRGGLRPAARSFAKPEAAPAPQPPTSPTPSSGLSAVDRAELEELRMANERFQKLLEESRHDRSKLLSEVQELKNQNAGLIEDHTRDVLNIKAKETQLVRARSDYEAAEQVGERLRRELERLKRALSRQELGVQSGMASPGIASPTHDDAGIFRDGNSYGTSNKNRMSSTSTVSEEKENGHGGVGAVSGGAGGGGNGEPYPRSKLHSPELRSGGSYAGSISSGRDSPVARVFRNVDEQSERSQIPKPGGAGGTESWKRAAEVTSQLKARIEQMKAKQGFARQ